MGESNTVVIAYTIGTYNSIALTHRYINWKSWTKCQALREVEPTAFIAFPYL